MNKYVCACGCVCVCVCICVFDSPTLYERVPLMLKAVLKVLVRPSKGIIPD